MNHVVVGPRQCGKTTISTIYALWRIMRQPNITVLVYAPKIALATELLGRIVEIRDRLDFGPTFVKRNKDYLELSNKSRVKIATTINALRGISCNVMIIDEAAFIKEPDDFVSCAIPTYMSSPNCQMLFLSTPTGLNCYFYDLYRKAYNHETELMLASRMNANDIPERSETEKLWESRIGIPYYEREKFYKREIKGEFYGFDK